MFIAALFIKPKDETNPKCPAAWRMDKQIWYQMTECYSTINNNQVLIYATAGAGFENIC